MGTQSEPCLPITYAGRGKLDMDCLLKYVFVEFGCLMLQSVLLNTSHNSGRCGWPCSGMRHLAAAGLH